MSEWIKCSERMPENPGLGRQFPYVLCASENGWLTIAFYDYNRKCWDDGDFYDHINDITHWMPLPAPPAEDA